MKRYRADIFIPDLLLAVEIHGEQHYKIVQWSKGMGKTTLYQRFHAQQHRDQLVRSFCRENSIRLLEISHEEIKNNKNNFKEYLENKIKEILSVPENHQ